MPRHLNVAVLITLLAYGASSHFQVRPSSIHPVNSALTRSYSFSNNHYGSAHFLGASKFELDLALSRTSNTTARKKRETECEPGYTECPDDLHCAEVGYFCCATDYGWSCPDDASCCPDPEVNGCAASGYACCTNGPGSCPEGSSCCQNSEVNGCAKAGYVCCTDGPGAYPEGSSCCPPPAETCVEPGQTCCGAGYCDAGDTCCKAGCASPGYKCCGADEQCPPGSECCTDEEGENYCADECVPSLIFHYDKWFQEIYENMCRGTAASETTDDPQTAILTLDDKVEKELKRAKARRRRAAGCQGRNGLRCLNFWNCDEFPFASTKEGGSGAEIKCVPKVQNDWQGTYYWKWLSMVLDSGKLVRGGKFRVKISGIDCTEYLRRRNNPRAEVPLLSQSGNVTVLSQSAFGNYSNGHNALFISLTENENVPGIYRFDYTLSPGTILSGGIIDDDGEFLTTPSALASGGTNTNVVSLDEDDGDITFLGWTTDNDVQVQYSVDVTPTSTPPSISSSVTSISEATGIAISLSSDTMTVSPASASSIAVDSATAAASTALTSSSSPGQITSTATSAVSPSSNSSTPQATSRGTVVVVTWINHLIIPLLMVHLMRRS